MAFNHISPVSFLLGKEIYMLGKIYMCFLSLVGIHNITIVPYFILFHYSQVFLYVGSF